MLNVNASRNATRPRIMLTSVVIDWPFSESAVRATLWPNLYPTSQNTKTIKHVPGKTSQSGTEVMSSLKFISLTYQCTASKAARTSINLLAGQEQGQSKCIRWFSQYLSGKSTSVQLGQPKFPFVE